MAGVSWGRGEGAVLAWGRAGAALGRGTPDDGGGRPSANEPWGRRGADNRRGREGGTRARRSTLATAPSGGGESTKGHRRRTLQAAAAVHGAGAVRVPLSRTPCPL